MSTSHHSINDLGLTAANHACACASHDQGLTAADHACSCGSDDHGAMGHRHGGNHERAMTEGSGDEVREHFLVSGMTCAHCVSSVTEELTEIDGVNSVSVALNVGGASRVMVVSSKPVQREDVESAIAEAGYELVSA